MGDIAGLIGVLVQQNGPVSMVLALILFVLFVIRTIRQLFGSGKNIKIDLQVMKAQMDEVDLVFQEIIDRCMGYYLDKAKTIERNDLLAPIVDYAYERHLENAIMITGRSVLRTFCRDNGWDKISTDKFQLLKSDRKKKMIDQTMQYMKKRFLPGARPSFDELEQGNEALLFWVDSTLDKLIDRCRQIGQDIRRGK